nr:zinc finger protein ZAT4-like [Ipomoea batatas]GMD84605.1 zinc finger protein ZAT4-like [Ipomoea batatas]
MDDQDLKFMCKLCKKKYPCGKSLGGHMRSHVNVIPTCSSSELDEQRGEMKKIASLKMQARFELGGNSGYGLRENPKKTWRATDSNLSVPQERVCKQCGKVFQSIKALCGHMACHSEKEKGGGLKDEHSWTSESKKVVVMDSNSDTEAEDLRNKSSVRPKRYKKIVHTCSFTLPNDVVVNSGSEIFEQDQQEVAKCLMMLSRDSGNWNGVSSFMESSDNNSVVLETKSSSIDMKTPKMDGSNRDESPKTRKMVGVLDAEVIESENSDSMYFLGENKTAESDVSVDGFHRNRDDKCFESKIRVEKDHLKVMNRIKGYIKSRAGSKDYDYRDFGVASNSGKHDSRRKSKDSSYDPEYKTGSYKKIKLSFSDTKKKKKKKYECLNCKKIFSSYQALGGHRPCHKRTLESRYETGENRPDVDTTYNNINGGNHREFLGSRKATAEGSPCYLGTKIKAKKAKGHECPFCHRVFKSGQALGGHKRSHFIDGAEENRHQRTQVIKAAIPGLLDLNVVPIESANDVQFMW